MNIPTGAEILKRARDNRKFMQAATATAVFLLAWILGRSIAKHDLTLSLGLAGFVLFYAVFFKRSTILLLAPLVMCLPNYGLDIPGPWAVSIEDAFVLLVFGSLLARSVFMRAPVFPRGSPILTPMLLFLGIAVFSIIKVILSAPEHLTIILKDLLRLTMMVFFYLGMVEAMKTKEQVLTVYKAILAVAVPMAAISWYIYLTESPFFYSILTMRPAYIFYKTNILRMISLMGSTSYTGLYYAMILALGATYPGWGRSRGLLLMKYPFLILIASCLLMTFNRGTWIGLLFGGAVLMFIGNLSWRKVTVAVFLLIGILLVASTHYFAQFDVEQKVNVLIEISRSSGTARIVRWLSAVNVLLDQPVLGVGYNHYAYVYGKYSIEPGVLTTYGSPHNMYVDFITGVGVVGFAIFCVLAFRLWKMHRDNMTQSSDPDLSSMSLGLFLTLTFFLGASAFDSFFFKPHHTSFLIFLCWAMATSIWRINHGGAAPEAQPEGHTVRQKESV